MLRGFPGPVDRLHVPGHLAPVLVGAQGQAVAHQMDDAGLDLGLGEDRVDRLRRAQRWASPPLRPWPLRLFPLPRPPGSPFS